LPLDCALGQDCFVQNYVDRDPGPGAADFTCGHLTYDGHKGTDFRPVDPRRRVGVLAAAAGTVKARRDGMPDRIVGGGAVNGSANRVADGDPVSGRECGNGVLLEHGDGWQTQYCHMARGSIAVRPGQNVASGDRLGVVGLSGQTEFHHLHFELRRDGRPVDPFLGPDAPPGCGVTGTPQWARPVAYVPRALLGLGFAASAPTLPDLEMGQFRTDHLPIEAPQIVFWAHVLGVRVNDRERLRVFAPDGAVLVEVDRVASPRNRAQWLAYVGRRNQAAWPPGLYRGEYRLLRDGAELLSGAARVTVGP